MGLKPAKRRRPGVFDPKGQVGQAMIIVVGLIFMATLIPIGIFYQAVQQLPLSRHDQDFQAALAAAEAGVDDYVNRMDQNQNYYVYDGTTGNQPPDGNQAFSTWVRLPGASAQHISAVNNPSYRYTRDISHLAQSGLIYLTSSGSSNGATRTVKVGLRRKSFLDYLYSTDYEVADIASYANPNQAKQHGCNLHHWEPNGFTGTNGPDINFCTFIYFIPRDVLNGPTHTNDDYYICGNPTFNGPSDSADTYPPRWVDNLNCGS